MYRSYKVFVNFLDSGFDSDWELLFFGRVKFTSYVKYMKYLSELESKLNFNSFYKYRVCDVFDDLIESQLELPF